MIIMAHALNMKIVAEGVETIHAFNWLISAQCNLMQDYSLEVLIADF